MTVLTVATKEISVLDQITYCVIHSPHQHTEQWVVRSKYLSFLTHCTESLLLFHFASRSRHHTRNSEMSQSWDFELLKHRFSRKIWNYFTLDLSNVFALHMYQHALRSTTKTKQPGRPGTSTNLRHLSGFIYIPLFPGLFPRLSE